jgi:hypothetical protein
VVDRSHRKGGVWGLTLLERTPWCMWIFWILEFLEVVVVGRSG